MKTLCLLAAAAMLLTPAGSVRADDDIGHVSGTVVSIRGNILQMRPWLRPKMTRVSFGDNTEILARRTIGKDFLKPGMRVYMRGFYNDRIGLFPFFIETAREPLGNLRQKAEGIKVDPGGFAEALGTVKSVDPFVFTDDNGKEYRTSLENTRRFWELYRGDRNGILIGTRLDATGPVAPDGVLQATTIVPDRNFAAVGTMFGQITGVKGRTLTIRPRYTQDSVEVILKDGCTLQREIEVDPDTIKIGDTVTFWGQRGRTPGAQNEVQAIALLLGDGRYPAATSGDQAAPFLTGKLTSLDPVQLALPDGQRLDIIVPAQMAIAHLETIRENDLRPGVQAMLVLERGEGDRFNGSHVIVDASPWVGYGQ
jgi:hypothetical protein